MSIVRRRKRPVEVDTVQWTGDNETEVQEFTGASHFYALDAEDRENSEDPEATATVFDNLHSTWVLVYTGQHIVRGVKREYYPIAEDVLAETYERADTAAPPADRQAYSGELAMLRTVVREVRSAAFVHEDLAAVRRLLTEHAVNHVDARNTAAAGGRPDTFPAWLAHRFDPNSPPWDGMSEDDRSYWEHEAAAVRRALARGGFKTDVTEGEDQT